MEKREYEIVHEDSRWNLVEREKLIRYKGKEILFDDYSNLQGEEFIRVVDLHVEATLKRKIYDQLNVLDVTNSFVDRVVLARLKSGSKKVDCFNSKTAIIGCVGVLRFFLDVINHVSKMGLVPFDTMEEALDWLVEG